MACCAAESAACCACGMVTSCLSRMCCGCCSSKKSSGQAAKAGYLFLLLLSTVLAIILRYKGAQGIDLPMWKVNCYPNINGTAVESSTKVNFQYGELSVPQKQFYASCAGNAAVYRISFMTAAFFLITAAGTACSRAVHTSWWLLKILLYLALVGSSFFIPNYVFDDSGYAWISRVLSVFFLMLQIFILIDFGYSWNASWYEKYESDKDDKPKTANAWVAGILFMCFTCYIFSIVGISLLYLHFGHCSINSFFITMTLLLIIISTGLQLTGETGALLPSSIVAAYATYLCWGALASNPDAGCNPTAVSGTAEDPWYIAAGVLITAASLAWTALNAARSTPQLFQSTADDELDTTLPPSSLGTPNPTAGQEGRISSGNKETPLIDANDGDSLESGKAGAIREEDVKLTEGGKSSMANHAQLNDEQAALDAADEEKYWIFHSILFLGSVYMAMLLTDWGSSTTADAGSLIQPDQGKTAMWVKILSQWFTVGVYIWTLVAPRLFPDRDFS